MRDINACDCAACSCRTAWVMDRNEHRIHSCYAVVLPDHSTIGLEVLSCLVSQCHTLYLFDPKFHDDSCPRKVSFRPRMHPRLVFYAYNTKSNISLSSQTHAYTHHCQSHARSFALTFSAHTLLISCIQRQQEHESTIAKVHTRMRKRCRSTVQLKATSTLV